MSEMRQITMSELTPELMSWANTPGNQLNIVSESGSRMVIGTSGKTLIPLDDVEVEEEPLPEGWHQCMQCLEPFGHEPVRRNGWPFCTDECVELMSERIDAWLS